MKTIKIASRAFIILSCLSLLYVSLLAFINPQAVMDLVNVTLPNNDAISSIRGIYGGVGLTIVTMLLYLAFADVKKGLIVLSMFWGLYAISRFITILVEGQLGAFGTQWLTIETAFCLIAVSLLLVTNRQKKIVA
jgi:hypothetical protein